MVHIVLLAYNEEAVIGTFLKELEQVLSRQRRARRYIVVDDGSTDGTAKAVRALKGILPVTLLSHPVNLGVGRGFDTGLRHAVGTGDGMDVVVTMEADRTNDPSYLLEMLAEIDRGYDVVCASRYRPGGRTVGFPGMRLLFSLCANWCMRLAYPVEGVRDYTIFFRAYRAAAVEKALRRFGDRFIERRGFTSNAEILYKLASAASLRCSEVPLVYRYDLKRGRSKMKVLRNIVEYGRLFAQLLRLKAGVPLRQALGLGAVGLAVGLTGIGWGLPGEARLAQLLPPALQADPVLRQRLAESWTRLYERLEANRRLPSDAIVEAIEVRPGWSTPPEPLLNSYRSYFLRSESPDEQKNLTYLAHMRPRRLRFEPFGTGYGGAFIYPLGAWYAAAAAVGAVRVTSDVGRYLEDPGRIRRVFQAGRLFNVLSFAACAVLIGAIARRQSGEAAGWAAGLLFSALPVTSIVSHTMNPYGWATLWFLLGLRWLLRYTVSGEGLVAAASAFGMCLGSSAAFWSVTLGVPLACLLRRPRPRPGAAAAEMLKAALVVAAVFCLTNPYFLFNFEVYRGEFFYHYNAFPYRPSPARMAEFLLGFMGFNMGLLAAFASAAAAAFHAFRPKAPPAMRLLALLFLAGFLDLSGRVTDPSHGRHFLPYLALACVLVAAAGREAVKALHSPLAWALTAAVLAHSGSAATAQLWNMALESRGASTRLEAGRWVNENIPSGSTIGLVARPQPADTPPLRFDRYRLVIFSAPSQLAGRPWPEYVVAGDTRLTPELRSFLREGYALVQSFEPSRPVPGILVRSDLTGINVGIGVWRRRPARAGA